MRGTNSDRNYEIDMMLGKVPYNKWPECDCLVHEGFQLATEGTYPHVLEEVQRLLALKEGYQVKTTGHSLGAVIAQMTGMSLIKDGIPVQMISFGPMRHGTDKYAHFSASVWADQFRYINNAELPS